MKVPIDQFDGLINSLNALHAELIVEETRFLPELESVAPSHRRSAINLVHYLALRKRDIRPLQYELAELGLSSLGRSEACVLHSLETVQRLVGMIAKRDVLAAGRPPTDLTYSAGRALLQAHTESLLGSTPAKRDVRVMVTMPSEAGDNPQLIREMLASGMDCMRINCAHDDAEVWDRMIKHLRRAQSELDRPCKVMMDLGGPKLRTGPVEPGACVHKIRPERDEFGRVTAPARVWLTPAEQPKAPPIAGTLSLPLPAEWLHEVVSGDELTFTDAREAERQLVVTDRLGPNWWAECRQSAYVVPGMQLKRSIDPSAPPAGIGELPARPGSLLLRIGDLLDLTRELVLGAAARFDEHGRLIAPAHIGCTLPEVFTSARAGEPIWFDDGKIGGSIVSADPDTIRVKITQARPGGSRLRAEKGINVPASRLRVSALTEKDRDDLGFIAKNADIVAFSFVSEAEDVHELQRCLAASGNQDVGIVLKIETKRAFENLPELLFAVTRSQCAGIMIARGDLAIECGFERLAEVQEEILWISEAAHLPVIWATQVLETLAQTGQPSRSEITDAAMGQRAECIMLNKGPYVVEAIQLLDGILRRMQSHQHKKRSLLRQLRAWDRKIATAHHEPLPLNDHEPFPTDEFDAPQ